MCIFDMSTDMSRTSLPQIHGIAGLSLVRILMLTVYAECINHSFLLPQDCSSRLLSCRNHFRQPASLSAVYNECSGFSGCCGISITAHSPPYHSFFVGMPVDSSGPITTVSSFQSCAEKQLYICFHNLSLLSAFSPCSSLYSKPFLCIFFKLYCYIPLPS